MTLKKPCIFNWSGGKDSSLALYHCLNNPELDIRYLLTTLNHSANRISMHGVREELLVEQAESIGIPLYQIRLPEMPGMKEYDETMWQHMKAFKEEGVDYAVFGEKLLMAINHSLIHLNILILNNNFEQSCVHQLIYPDF